MDRRFKTSKSARLLLGAVLAYSALPCAAATVRPEPTPQMVADQEVAFITFVAGEALMPEEQMRVATAAMQVFADNLAVVLRNYTGKINLAAKIAGNPFETARLRYLNRKVLFKQFSGPLKDSSDVADAAALVAHDPVIAYNVTPDILFTRRSINDLRAASAWMAGVLNIPGPSPAFDDNVKDALKQRLTTMDNLTAFRMADVAADLTLAQAWIKHSGPASIADISADARVKLANADANERDWSLAVSTSTFADMVAKKQVAHNSNSAMNRLRTMMVLQSRMNLLNQVTKNANQSALRRERHSLFSGCMPGGNEDINFCNGQ